MSETGHADDAAVAEPRLRADARRNRARILAAAVEAFATGGLSVPVQEIARRAGVGTGTVSRHFPTKEALFEAVLLSRAAGLSREATRLMDAADPGAAFFEFFGLVITEGAANLGLAEALTGAGYDLDAATRREGVDPMTALGLLLARAQRAGAVRPDVETADVKALIGGCLSRAADQAALDRMVAVARRGLENGLSFWLGRITRHLGRVRPQLPLFSARRNRSRHQGQRPAAAALATATARLATIVG